MSAEMPLSMRIRLVLNPYIISVMTRGRHVVVSRL